MFGQSLRHSAHWLRKYRNVYTERNKAVFRGGLWLWLVDNGLIWMAVAMGYCGYYHKSALFNCAEPMCYRSCGTLCKLLFIERLNSSYRQHVLVSHPKTKNWSSDCWLFHSSTLVNCNLCMAIDKHEKDKLSVTHLSLGWWIFCDVAHIVQFQKWQFNMWLFRFTGFTYIESVSNYSAWLFFVQFTATCVLFLSPLHERLPESAHVQRWRSSQHSYLLVCFFSPWNRSLCKTNWGDMDTMGKRLKFTPFCSLWSCSLGIVFWLVGLSSEGGTWAPLSKGWLVSLLGVPRMSR